MTINATAPILLALYVAAAERAGRRPRAKVSGTTQNDILKEYIARGTWIYPPRSSMRLVTDVFEFASRELPRWNTISISGYHMREAGATAAQELAFTLADGDRLRRGGGRRGAWRSTTSPRRLSFFFAAWSELFEEVAKFRAARRMWARIMKERFGAQNARSMMCRFHTQTAGSSLTAQSIDNNVVRTTLQALAAVLGGDPEPAHELPRRGPRPADRGRGPARPADPADPRPRGGRRPRPPIRSAGSWFVESLTDEPRGGRERLPRRDRRHGRHARRDRGRLPAAPDPGGGLPGPARDRARGPDRRGRQPVPRRGRGRRARRSTASTPRRSGARSRASAACARSATRPRGRPRCGGSRTRLAATGNLLPPIIEAVAAYATVGEISDRLRAAWGVHRELITV